MGIFSSLFGGSKKTEEEKNFDILKYDGIRAMRIGKLTYALKCFEEATAIQEDLETMNHQANCYIRVNRNDVPVVTAEEAVARARNVAAPLNAKRLNRNTPCVKGGHCYDCSSPDRICGGVQVLLRAPGGADYEIVLIDEELGY